MELSIIERLEQELQELYALLDHNNDWEERQNILQAIQTRNLRVSRLLLCE